MRPKKEIDIDNERIKKVAKSTACTNRSQVYQVLAEEMGVSRETFRKRLNETGNDLADELEKIYEENNLLFGAKSSKRLQKILDIEYDEMDHDGQRIHISVATDALKRTDKYYERKSKLRELEASVKALMDENDQLKKKIGKITDGSNPTTSSHILPVYIVQMQDIENYTKNAQEALMERARQTCQASSD